MEGREEKGNPRERKRRRRRRRRRRRKQGKLEGRMSLLAEY